MACQRTRFGPRRVIVRVGGAAPPAASRCSARTSLRAPSRGDPPLGRGLACDPKRVHLDNNGDWYYYTIRMPLERVVLSVDVACFALDRDGRLILLLVQRAEAPFAHAWALPGGAVEPDEPLDAAAARLLAERTGIRSAYLEQLYTFGDPGRDPRGRTVSVTYFALFNST